MQPGLYDSIPFDGYRAIEAANASVLKQGLVSPLHLLEAIHEKREQTGDQAIGEAFHLHALEPDLFKQRFAVRPKVDGRTTAGKAANAAWDAENVGKSPLTEQEMAQIGAMTAACHRHKSLRTLLKRGQPEVTAIWTDPATGVLCKARFDFFDVDGPVIVDLKSARSAAPDEFARAAAVYRYDMQAAHYIDGGRILLGRTPRFVFGVVEKEPPYAVAVYEPSPAMIEAGRNRLDVALRVYKEVTVNGCEAGYSEEVQELDLPAWSQAGWVDDS